LRYIDIFERESYNRKIFDVVKDLNINNFKDLWSNKKEYKKHLKKRI
jgi:hypothetical protein